LAVSVINAVVLEASATIVINHNAKTRFFGLYFCRQHCGSFVNHFHIIGLTATEFGEIMQNKSYYAVQDHSRSSILEQVKSPYATSLTAALVNPSTLCRASNRARQADRPQFAKRLHIYFTYTNV